MMYTADVQCIHHARILSSNPPLGRQTQAGPVEYPEPASWWYQGRPTSFLIAFVAMSCSWFASSTSPANGRLGS